MSVTLQEARTVVDFGLLVLIWMVQLIVYPGFKYMDLQAFPQWHSQYSTLISFIVIPLMLGQFGIVGAQLLQAPGWAIWLAAILVGIIWISTFFQAVPVHNALQAARELSGDTHYQLTSRLVSVNWVRTILWTVVFGLGLVRS